MFSVIGHSFFFHVRGVATIIISIIPAATHYVFLCFCVSMPATVTEALQSSLGLFGKVDMERFNVRNDLIIYI